MSAVETEPKMGMMRFLGVGVCGGLVVIVEGVVMTGR